MRCAGWFLAVLLSSAIARADGGESEAERLFREGRDAMKAGDPATACARFAASQSLDPAPGTLLNLALCEEKLGQLSLALRHAKEAEKLLPADDDRLPIARALIARVKPALVTVAEGESSKVTVAPAAERPVVDHPYRSVGIAFTTVGLAGLVVGTVSGLSALGARQTVREHCIDKQCDDEGLAAGERGRTMATLSTVGFAVGALSLAVGGVLFFHTTEVRSAIAVSPQGATFTLVGSF